MANVPSNLIPSRITSLPEAPVADPAGYFPIVISGTTYKVQFSQIQGNVEVPASRTITAGTGLTGGGSLSADITIAVANGGIGNDQLDTTGVAAGSYGTGSLVPVITVNTKGRVTSISTTPVVVTGYVSDNIQVVAGTGLTGGGTLTQNRTLAIDYSATIPSALGSASAGSANTPARADHVHPAVDLSDTTETTGALPLGRGGTGTALSPIAGAVIYSTGSQFALSTIGTAGQVLASNGTGAPTWQTISGAGTVTSIDVSSTVSGVVFSGGPITTAGVITMSGTLAISNGGTGASTASGARTNLGLGSMATQDANNVSISGGSVYVATAGATSGNITTLTGSSWTVTNFTATSATISNFTFTSSTVTDLTATRLTSTSASISHLGAGSASVTTLTVASAGITTLTSTSANITTLTSGSATLTNLTSTSGTVSTLKSTSADITNLAVSSLTVSSLSLSNATFTSATITTLTSTSAGITTLSSGSLTATNLTATSGTVTTLTSTSAGITNLSVSSLTVSSLSLANATFTSATITTLTSTSAGIATLSGTSLRYSSADITTLTSGSATLTNLTATSGTVTTLTSTSAGITNLSVSSLTVSSLSLSNATFTSATITTLKSTSATVDNLASSSADITTLTGTTFGTTATTQLRGASAQITTLTSTSADITTLTSGSLTVSGNSVAAKFVPTGGSATGNGMYLPAANTLAFSTNGTRQVSFDEFGNVLVGGTSSLSPAVNSVEVSINNPLLSSNGGSVLAFGIQGSRAGFVSASPSTNLEINSTSGYVQLSTTGGSIRLTSAGNLTVSSSTLVTNLNADLLDGQHGSYYLDLANATGNLSGGTY
jgi:hypothetical protein